MKWRAAVNPSILRRRLWLGSSISILGAIILIFAGIAGHLGFFVFLFSILLIACGLKPYKKLWRQEVRPDEILITEDEILHYKHYQIPLKEIEQVIYKKSLFTYGIVLVTQRGKVFAPYFSERSGGEISDVID